MADGFWDNAQAAQAQMKKIKDLQKWIADYESLEGAVDELKIALEFYKEEVVEEAEVDQAYAHAHNLLEDLELRNMLRGEGDIMSAVLKINSAAPRARTGHRCSCACICAGPRLMATAHPLPTFWRATRQASKAAL